MSQVTMKSRMDDHALDRVPEAERKSWVQLSNNTMGITSTIVMMLSGALVTFTAGMKIGLLAGICGVLIGTIFGYLIGDIARKEGLSSTVITRYYGFGVQGSVVSAFVFGFMILGFLSLENVLLYNGVLFFFNMEPSVWNAIVIYGLFTIAWVTLALFGIRVVYRVASVTLIALLIVLVYMIVNALAFSGIPFSEVMSFAPQFGSSGGIKDFLAALNIVIGTTGALSLVAADTCRYARTKKDVLFSNLFGMIVMNVAMLIAGGTIAYVGMQPVVAHYMNTQGLTADQASAIALNDMAAFFIILAGVAGFILMFLANGKAQVLNTYSGSLALTNIFAAFGLKGNRAIFVILANVIALVLIALNILGFVSKFLGMLGVVTTCVATIVIVDHYFVRKITHRHLDAHLNDVVNLAGVVTLVIASAIALSSDLLPMPFVTSTVISIILYPLLRLYVFKPNLKTLADGIVQQTSIGHDS